RGKNVKPVAGATNQKSNKGGRGKAVDAAPRIEPKAANRAAKVAKAANRAAKVAKAVNRVAKVAKAVNRVAKTATARNRANASPATLPSAKVSKANRVAKAASHTARSSSRQAERRTSAPASKPRRGTQLGDVAPKSERGRGGAAKPKAQQLKFGFGDERSELAVLQKQNRHLLLQIAKRRALITVSKQAVDELMRELSERVLPYRDELFAITREVCDLRDRLLDSSGLPAAQREKVRW